MRVIYDQETGRVLALGDAAEPGAGQAVAELTPEESKALAAAVATADDLAARARNAVAEQQAASERYAKAADAAKQAFVSADKEANKAGGAVGFDAKRKVFVVIGAAPPPPPPTPEDDAETVERLASHDPQIAALVRWVERRVDPKQASATAATVRKG